MTAVNCTKAGAAEEETISLSRGLPAWKEEK